MIEDNDDCNPLDMILGTVDTEVVTEHKKKTLKIRRPAAAAWRKVGRSPAFNYMAGPKADGPMADTLKSDSKADKKKLADPKADQPTEKMPDSGHQEGRLGAGVATGADSGEHQSQETNKDSV